MAPIDKNGNIKGWVADLLAIFGAILVFAPLLLQWSAMWVILSMVVGLCIVGFASIAIRSKTLDIRAFTTDPLGWRKAKKTYQAKDTPSAEKSPDDPP